MVVLGADHRNIVDLTYTVMLEIYSLNDRAIAGALESDIRDFLSTIKARLMAGEQPFDFLDDESWSLEKLTRDC